MTSATYGSHDDVIKWKHFPRYWPFERGIHRLPANSPHKDQWRRALMFSLICAWINTWVHNCKAADLRCHHVHYGVTVMRIWTRKRHSLPCPPRQAMECLLKFNLIFRYFLVLHFMLLFQNNYLLVALYDISGSMSKSEWWEYPVANQSLAETVAEWVKLQFNVITQGKLGGIYHIRETALYWKDRRDWI